MTTPAADWISRSRPDTTPVVSVWSKPAPRVNINQAMQELGSRPVNSRSSSGDGR